MKKKVIQLISSFILFFGVLFIPIFSLKNIETKNNLLNEQTTLNDESIVSNEDWITNRFTIDVNLLSYEKKTIDIKIETNDEKELPIKLTYGFTTDKTFNIYLSIEDKKSKYNIGPVVKTPGSYDDYAMFGTVLDSKWKHPSSPEVEYKEHGYDFNNLSGNSVSIMFVVDDGSFISDNENYIPIRIDFKFSNKAIKKHKGVFLKKQDLFYREDKKGYSFYEKKKNILKEKNKIFNHNDGWEMYEDWYVRTTYNTKIKLGSNEIPLSVYTSSTFEYDLPKRDIITNEEEITPIYAKKDKIGNWLLSGNSDGYLDTSWINRWNFSLGIEDSSFDIDIINDFINFLNDEIGVGLDDDPSFALSHEFPVKVTKNREFFKLKFSSFTPSIPSTEKIIEKLNIKFSDKSSFEKLLSEFYVDDYIEYTNEPSFGNKKTVFANNGIFLYENNKNVTLFISDSQILFLTLFSLMIVITLLIVLYFIKSNKTLNENIIVKNYDDRGVEEDE